MNQPGSPAKVCGRCGSTLPTNAPEGLCPRCLGALNLADETVFTETDAPRIPPPSPEQIATHFPQLEIIECLGRGGMGVVYKARQKSLGRLVALKLLAPEREKDPQFAERFSREAQALAQLDHPHIVTIYDFGQTNGFFYLLMEFVDGVNLRQLLRSRKLTPEEALAIVPPLCEALQFAHERGIVHRDIKPENLLLTKDGRVKIADFGIAKMLGDETQVAEEKAAGTPGYMAPEQMEMPPRVDSRADIYSLGVVFYEMLTGELPKQKFAAPSRRIAVDVRIDEVVLRALEKSPELRWQTAAEMRTQVEAIAAAGTTGTAKEWHPKRQWLFWLLAVPGTVALLIFNSFLLYFYVPSTNWSHTYGYASNVGQLLMTVNALLLCVALDVGVLRSLWVWAHAAPAQPARLWHHTRLWWAFALICALFPWLLFPHAPRIESPAQRTEVGLQDLSSDAQIRIAKATEALRGIADIQKRGRVSAADWTIAQEAAKTIQELQPANDTAKREWEIHRADGKVELLHKNIEGKVMDRDIVMAPTATQSTNERNAEPPATAANKLSATALKFRVDEAEIRLAAADKTAKRQAELLNQGQISNEEYDKTALDLELAKIALRAAQAEWREAQQAPETPATKSSLPPTLSVITDGNVMHPDLPVTSGETALRKRDDARKSLKESEQTLRLLQQRLIEGTISPEDYRNAERSVQALRDTVQALEENPNTVTLPSGTAGPYPPLVPGEPRVETSPDENQPAKTAPASVAANTGGIGVALKEESGSFTIGSILPDSPAAKDGALKPGHEIRSIGDSGDHLVSIAGWKLPDVVARLRGKEGTQVSLFVVKDGVGTIVTLIRRHLPELEAGREHPKTEAELSNAQFNQTPRQGGLGLRPVWRFSRVVNAFADDDETATSPATWIPSNPPLLLVRRKNDIAAFSTAEDRTEAGWSFGLEGERSSPPAWDAKRRQIYFGNGTQMIALDERGHVVWNCETNGKILARPVEIGGLVIFGNEDQAIYALDAQTGGATWKFATGAAVASTPAVGLNFLVIGADDGVVRALDPRTAEELWRYKAGAAIRAPLVMGENAVYGATRAGDVVALEAKTGKLLWTARLGGPIETALAVGADRLFVVEGGRVSALALNNGTQYWQTPPSEYIGAPMIADDTLIVACRLGNVRRLDFTSGRIVVEWKAPGAQRKDAPTFVSGPTAGEGALWLTDTRGAVWRLGPEMPTLQRTDAPPTILNR